MKQFINIKHILLALFIAGASISVNAQKFISKKSMNEKLEKTSPQIEGKKSGQVNKESYYTVKIPDGIEIGEVRWSVDAKGGALGKIITSSKTSATILWEEAGETNIYYDVLESSRGRMQAVFTVIITADAPDIPPVPSIVSQTCANAVLQKTGNIPSGEMWYWQGTTKYGTNTDYPATSNYTVIESGIYKIRAKNLSTGIWSVRDSSVEVILDENAAGQTWYADTDGDGKGDPNDTIVQCSPPTGYVLNSDDQCPTVNGGGTYNGCEAQDSSNQNYVYTITAQVPTTNIDGLKLSDDAIENVTYFDELGRAKQSIAIRQSPNRKDIVSHIAYDEFGRQAKEYLPYASTSDDGLLKLDAYVKTNAFYNTEKYQYTNNPYSEKVQEASPLGRVHEQTAPGNDWLKGANRITGKEYSDGQSIKMEYQTNLISEVRMFNVNTTLSNNTYTPTLTLNMSLNSGNYQAGTLTKVILKDENWTLSDGLNHTTEEFKDKNGQVVLKRSYALADATTPQKHDTYYVYDDYGNLTYVLPPKVEVATTSFSTILSTLNDLSYQYKYDDRNRLVEKKIPGKGWEYIVYDKLDRPVLTQDANQKAKSPDEWLFTKYDKLGRVVYTGIYKSNSLRTSLQTTFNNKVANQNYETKLTYSGTLGQYYSNTNFPNTNLEVLMVNYYDDYNFDLAGTISPAGIGQVYEKNLTINVKGLATGSKVKTLGNSAWTTTVSYYDEKGQPIYLYSKNEFLKTSDIVKSDIDFTGKVVETTSYHTNTNDAVLGTQTVIDIFKYDHVGRLENQKQFLANGSVYNNAKIVENKYDELGQLVSKGIGGEANGSNSLQTVDYKYNIRGWLTNINDVNNLGDDVFAFNIKYQDIDDVNKKLFNGNISQTNWKSASVNATGNPVSNQYTYNYDALNRLTSAIDNTGNYNLNSVNYDKNGNILNLQRKGHLNTNATSFGIMDDLVYTYNNGNQLTKVLDNGNDAFGFKDGVNTSAEYVYDVNGNMKKDLNKGINNIVYNHLNLPEMVELGAGKIFYTYDATGVKLEKRVEENSTITSTSYAGNYVYENDNLQFFYTAEGYVKPNYQLDRSGNPGFLLSLDYIYQYKDHLGNVRVTYADNVEKDGKITPNEIIEEKNYYAFGLLHKGYNNVISSNGNSTAQKFGFTGKEHQDELGLGWIDITARNYDAALGRWMNLDPLAEEMRRHSPYNYAFNNPVYYIDPDGMSPINNCPSGDCEDVPSGSKSQGTATSKEKASKPIVKAVQEQLVKNTGVIVGPQTEMSASDTQKLQNMVQGNLSLNENSSSVIDINVENGPLIADDAIQISYEGAQFDKNDLSSEGTVEVDVADSGQSSNSMSSENSKESSYGGGAEGGGKSGKASAQGSRTNSNSSTSSTNNSTGKSTNNRQTYYKYSSTITHTYNVKYINKGLNKGVTSQTISISTRTVFLSPFKLD